ncbi:hypothetical protein PF005_g865 [Phytophthora fragariae]|uniref:Uncharacterized protein n=1 Tax=Phytophthora fragariae TaxID=53985 RepID=A0A6A3ZK99_9STRA|nr:hypothetical protein PF003_g20482 [Phytophthora fragariae]KAE8949924.1 hypothetical protein PF009_g561 [Phytophthora fragariae]KAE9030700.1 hypothetical protein PF011_g477 [Phytophthora fragariae]KAE9138562.1 hypothetical protein PF010_g932 [Phytophthora fragariae]KAE9140727.1 hypothetical protein PF007_g560 [Phytophthora fragariae]
MRCCLASPRAWNSLAVACNCSASWRPSGCAPPCSFVCGREARTAGCLTGCLYGRIGLGQKIRS